MSAIAESDAGAAYDEDIAELKALLATATRDRVKQLLEKDIQNVERARGEAASQAEKAAAAAAAAAPPPAPASANSNPSGTNYIAIDKYAWSQDREFVEVTVMDGIDGVGELPKEQVQCSFGPSSFDLCIHGLHSKNYRLRVTNLEKEIKPSKSKIVVKRNRVTVMLRKSGEFDTWMDIFSKKAKKAKDESRAKSDDPSAGLMDIMRDMYEEGDDNMRKMLAEAWTKSREAQHSGKRGVGFDDDF